MILKIIHLNDEPAEFQGEVPSDFLDWEGFHPTGPVSYEINAWIQEDKIYAHGHIFCEGTVSCARCLEELPITLDVPDYAGCYDLPENGDLDLTPHFREEILIGLPSYKKCELDEHSKCPFSGRYWGDVFSGTPGPPLADHWAALDRLKIEKKNKDKN